MIEDSIHAAVRFGAVVLAMPVKETIKMSNPDGTVLKTLDRESLWQVQTPQTFQVNVIKEAYYRATQDGFIGTDGNRCNSGRSFQRRKSETSLWQQI
jgi:2-C-methyl-D-erythritol 4-phosphate cytidylyltransferase